MGPLVAVYPDHTEVALKRCVSPSVPKIGHAHPRPLVTTLGIVFLVLGFAVLLNSPAAAFPEPPYLGPPDGFTDAETEHVRIFVQNGASMDADAFALAYGLAIERAHVEISTLVGEPSRTLELMVYADRPGFAAATSALVRPEPTASDVVADPGIGDVAVALPPFLTKSSLDAENNIRHAMAHALVRRAAAGEIPRGFDEGIAQYVERPVSGRLARTAALLQNANQRADLLTWSDLNRPRPMTADPNLVAAHDYGVIAFLVERHGLQQLGAFINALAEQPDWRSAMREVYQRSPTELEEQWRENLPHWTAGEWRDNVFAAFDLQPARDLLDKAHYAAAKTELERSLRLYTDLGDTAMQTEVEELLRLGDVGLQAEALMTQTQEALERHTYDRAQTLLTQARAQYAQLPADQRTDDLLNAYDGLARAGLAASTELDTSRRLSHRWANYPEARASAVSAGTTFATLGDEEMTERSHAVLTDLDARQQRLVLMLGALALLTIAWLALWLWARGPAELDWK